MKTITEINSFELKFVILQSCANSNLKPISLITVEGGGFVDDVNRTALRECREDGATPFDLFIDNLIQDMADNGECFVPASEDDVEVIAEELKNLARLKCGSAADGESPIHSGRADVWWATIQGGVGPDVWEKDIRVSAVDLMDAATQAEEKAEYFGGWVARLERAF